MPGGPRTVTTFARRSQAAASSARTSASALRLPIHKRRRSERTSGSVGDRGEGPRTHRLPLTLHDERLGWVRDDRSLHQAIGRVADQHVTGSGVLLQPRRDVDGVAGHEQVAGVGQDLACVHTDPRGDPELHECSLDLVCSTNRPKCIVLVHDRDAEHGHNRVADELLDCPAMPFEDLADAVEVGRHQGAHYFRIHTLAHGSRPDDVAEQDGHGLAHVLGTVAGGGERYPHIPHRTNPSGFSWPHFEQAATAPVYDVARSDAGPPERAVSRSAGPWPIRLAELHPG